MTIVNNDTDYSAFPCRGLSLIIYHIFPNCKISRITVYYHAYSIHTSHLHLISSLSLSLLISLTHAQHVFCSALSDLLSSAIDHTQLIGTLFVKETWWKRGAKH